MPHLLLSTAEIFSLDQFRQRQPSLLHLLEDPFALVQLQEGLSKQCVVIFIFSVVGMAAFPFCLRLLHFFMYAGEAIFLAPGPVMSQ